MLTLSGNFKINGSACYGDKSITHRALIFGAISQKGATKIKNACVCADTLSTAECLRKLGAKILFEGTTAYVEPIGVPENGAVLDCGNSGTTARLLAGVVAGLNVDAVFIGDASLSKRPMDRVTEALSELGAVFEKRQNCLFSAIKRKGEEALKGKNLVAKCVSAQVKSAVLLAGLFADGVTSYTEKIRTRDHTEIMLSERNDAVQISGNSVSVTRGRPSAKDITVPNDMSAAAFFIALSLMTKRPLKLENVGVNSLRTGLIDIVMHSGAKLTLDNVRYVCGEKVADITLNKSVLTPLYASCAEISRAIDEVPVLAALALTVKGRHVFSGVNELKNKETDRIASIINFVLSSGQKAYFDKDTLTVESDGELLKGKYFKTFGDHRMAMSEAVTAIAAGGGTIDGVECIDVSCPNFLRILGIKPYELALLGSDISKSLSPMLMSCLSLKAGLDVNYKLVLLASEIGDGELLQNLSAFDGANVTMPFKKRAASLTEAEEPSVNTVGKRIKATSTDGYGLMRALESNGFDVAGKRLTVVGAGGAAEAAVRELISSGAEISIVNRTKEKARALSEKYGLNNSAENAYGILSFVPPCEFLNTVNVPENTAFVFDAYYKGESILKRRISDPNKTVFISGLEMLYHQGAKSFSLWTDTPIQNDYAGFLRTVQNEIADYKRS